MAAAGSGGGEAAGGEQDGVDARLYNAGCESTWMSKERRTHRAHTMVVSHLCGVEERAVGPQQADGRLRMICVRWQRG